MAPSRISFVAVIASLVFLAWTGNVPRTRARTESDPVVASNGTQSATAPRSDGAKEMLDRGKELFTREWIAGDRRSHAGDGLGPVYNAQSCAACHRLGGIGGAGTNETNVSLVTVFVSEKINHPTFGSVLQHPLRPADAPKKFTVGGTPGREIELAMPSQDEVVKVHPILLTQPSFPFHRYGVGPEFARWKDSIFPKNETRTIAISNRESNRRHSTFTGSGSLTLIESKRNTPPLFGAGLINAIPDQVLDEVAAEQAKASAGASAAFRLGDEVFPVRGRVARLNDGRAGRFGWKAAVATLREFTLQACSSELGLEVPGFARAAPAWKSEYKAPGIDLTSAQCDALTGFIASLPSPSVRTADSTQQAGAIKRGRELFASVGCAVCHRPNLGSVEGIYSDLLLHNMGHELSDAGAYNVLEPEVASKDKARQPRAANESEWRTPPLWGMRDSAPYLHDGRAATIADAVALHGGEGRSAAQGYERLSENEREQVELFLKTLTAPAIAP